MIGNWRCWSLAAEETKDSLETVQERIVDEQAVLVDVREKWEWNSGQVSETVCLTLSGLRNAIKADSLAQRIPKEKIVDTHCVVGKRAVTAAEILKKHDYDVRSLKTGYKDLLRAGFKQAAH